MEALRNNDDDTPTLQLLNGGEEDSGAGNGSPLKVRWTREETRKVAAKIVEQVRKQGWRKMPQVGDRTGREMVKDFLAIAMQELPRERRRPITSLQAFSTDFWQWVDVQLTSAVPAPVVSPTAPAIETPAPAAEVAPSPATPATEEAPNGFAKAFGESLASLFGRIEARMSKQDAEIAMLIEDGAKLRGEYNAAMRRIAELETLIAATPERKKLPRVILTGCNRPEFERVRLWVEDTPKLEIDLRWVDSDRTNPGTLYGECDYVIGLRWMGHALQDQLRRSYPNAKYVFMDGGANKAMEQLQAWFLQ